MGRLILIFVLTLASSMAHGDDAPTRDEILATVQKHVPTARKLSAPADPIKAFAGKFSPSTELKPHVGGALSGDYLYLFADRSFIYVHWADISPRKTIHDKGSWTYEGGFIVLSTDNSVPQKHAVKHDSRYVPFLVTFGGSEHLSLIDTNRKFDFFHKKVEEPIPPGVGISRMKESLLRICTYARSETYTESEEQETKERLMKDGWRPEYFEE